MATARHPIPPEIAALSLDEIAERHIGRFRDKQPDWEAFEDAKIDGYHNDGLEPAYIQVMLGRGRPETMGYADDDLYRRRAAHIGG